MNIEQPGLLVLQFETVVSCFTGYISLLLSGLIKLMLHFVDKAEFRC